MRREPVTHPAEDRQHVGALQPLDVDRLQAVQHRDVHHLAGAVPQRGQHRQRRLVQVDVLGDRGAELVERQAEPVLAGGRVLLQQPLRLERRDQPVRGALAEAEPAAELGDAELLVGVRNARSTRAALRTDESSGDRVGSTALTVCSPRRIGTTCPAPRDILPLRGDGGHRMRLWHIAWFDRHDPALEPDLGGKNTSLGIMTMAGLPVPSGFAVTAEAYRRALRDTGIDADLARMVERARRRRLRRARTGGHRGPRHDHRHAAPAVAGRAARRGLRDPVRAARARPTYPSPSAPRPPARTSPTPASPASTTPTSGCGAPTACASTCCAAGRASTPSARSATAARCTTARTAPR